MSRFFVWNRRYSKMKQEQDKSISNNVLEAMCTILVSIYYKRLNV
ncbi:Uncharacterised protein [Streptococcus pneumoniae]|nr:Uncharacterised protein [Streptococcus pneumoniae]